MSSSYAFPDYTIKSNPVGVGFYLVIFVYSFLCFASIGPLVKWSRNAEKKRAMEEETKANQQKQLEVTQIASKSHTQRTPAKEKTKKAPEASMVSGSHVAPASALSRYSARSGKSSSGLMLFLDRVAAADYPDRDPENSRSGSGKTAQSTSSGSPSAATTSRLITHPNQKLSSLMLDVGGRRWKNRRPIGRVDVIKNTIVASEISALSSSVSKQPGKERTQGMSDLASSVLQESKEVRDASVCTPRPPMMMQYQRSRFPRRPSRAGSYAAASEKSIERSVMSSIVDDITPNDAADANDPGKGNAFTHPQFDHHLKLGFCSGFIESLLVMAAPGEEMRRVIKSSVPLALGAASEAVFRLVSAAFISRFLGTESMIAYLLVDLFVKLTSEELSGAIIDAASSFVQACIHSQEEPSYLEAGRFIQHAIILQLVLGVPLLLLWALKMEYVVYWLVQSEEVAKLALGYARIVVFYYLVQSLTRTFTVGFHICGHDLFESVIDMSTSALKVIMIACVVAKVEEASLETVAYIQVFIGIVGALARIIFPAISGWIRPFCKGMIGQIGFLHDWSGFVQLMRAIVPLSVGTILEYGEWEILTLSLHHLGFAEVAAWAILGALWDVLEALTEGIGEAAATQVTFLLAAWQPERARKLANTVMYLAVVQSIVVSSILYMTGSYLAVALTPDPTLQHFINNSITFLGLANVAMAFTQVSWSLIGAQGRFRLATCVVFAARWLVTIPVALLIIFVWHLDVQAVGGALIMGYSTACAILTHIVLRSDWERIARIIQDMKKADNGAESDSRDEQDGDDHGDPFDDDDDSSSDDFGFGIGASGEQGSESINSTKKQAGQTKIVSSAQ